MLDFLFFLRIILFGAMRAETVFSKNMLDISDKLIIDFGLKLFSYF